MGSKFHIEINNDLIWRLLYSLCIMVLIFSVIDSAFAGGGGSSDADDDVIGNTLCRLIENLSGNIAKGIATLAIFSVGVGLFLGKINWGIAAATAAGVGIIFSAPQLVSWLAGDNADGQCDSGD
ncbi:MAG: TrbC/VirB2 family protein [Rickettsiaceae bacterium]|nr:TrbC/VirB2 family protein [Rickettsiaceae bacterium]